MLQGFLMFCLEFKNFKMILSTSMKLLGINYCLFKGVITFGIVEKKRVNNKNLYFQFSSNILISQSFLCSHRKNCPLKLMCKNLNINK